ncbi:hypothetical protein MSKU3_3321 [Komagataeibacter oboediens]|nr:hypothetical protein MSKU3_3321 [Komagataeibacter oboediens]
MRIWPPGARSRACIARGPRLPAARPPSPPPARMLFLPARSSPCRAACRPRRRLIVLRPTGSPPSAGPPAAPVRQAMSRWVQSSPCPARCRASRPPARSRTSPSAARISRMIPISAPGSWRPTRRRDRTGKPMITSAGPKPWQALPGRGWSAMVPVPAPSWSTSCWTRPMRPMVVSPPARMAQPRVMTVTPLRPATS